MKKIFFALGLIPSFTLGAVKPVSLRYESTVGGIEFCRTELTISSKKEVLACEGRFNGEPTRIYVRVTPLGKQQYRVSLRKEIIQAGGEIKIHSSPSVAMLENEKAEMSMSADERPEAQETDKILIYRRR